MNNIFEPLTLSSGSHKAGSGEGCAMNVISWENGDKTITDYPACSDRFLSRIVQGVNDALAGYSGLLNPTNSIIALDLGHATVGTTNHNFSDLQLKTVYMRCAALAARKVLHLDKTGMAVPAVAAAEKWLDNPTAENATTVVEAYILAAFCSAGVYAEETAEMTTAEVYMSTVVGTVVDNKNIIIADALARSSKAAAIAYASYTDPESYTTFETSESYMGYFESLIALTATLNNSAANRVRVDLAWETINLFKTLTSTASPAVDETVVACAVAKMRVTA